MSNYGFSLNVDGDAAKKLKEVGVAIDNVSVKAGTAQTQVENSAAGMGESFKRLGSIIVATFAIERVIGFGKQILETTAEFQGFENRIKFASTSLGDASANMQFLRDETERLHLPMRTVYEGFSQMEAGLKGMGIEGTKLRTLFDGISTAAATLHMPEAQLERSLYDLKEIGEVGVNMRVGRSLMQQFTGIGPVIKQEFGKSINELAKEKFNGTEFLSRLGPALAKYYASGLENYGASLQAKMVDTQNKLYQTQVSLGEKLTPVYMSIMNGLMGVMNTVKEFIDYLSRNGDSLKVIIKLVEGLGIAFVIYKSVGYATIAMEAARTAGLAVMEAAQMTAMFGAEGLKVAIEGLGVSIEALGLGAIAAALGIVIEQFASWNSELDASIEKISHLKQFQDASQKQGDKYDELMSNVDIYSQLNPSQKANLLDQVNQALPQIQKSDSDMRLQMAILKNKMAAMPLSTEMVKGEGGRSTKTFVHSSAWEDLNGQLEQMQPLLSTNQGRMMRLMHLQDVMDSAGVKPLSGGKDALGATASGTSEMGMHGGLGEAKIINIKIGTIQEVKTTDNRELKTHAADAVDVILRMVNNINNNQSAAVM